MGKKLRQLRYQDEEQFKDYIRKDIAGAVQIIERLFEYGVILRDKSKKENGNWVSSILSKKLIEQSISAFSSAIYKMNKYSSSRMGQSTSGSTSGIRRKKLPKLQDNYGRVEYDSIESIDEGVINIVINGEDKILPINMCKIYPTEFTIDIELSVKISNKQVA